MLWLFFNLTLAITDIIFLLHKLDFLSGATFSKLSQKAILTDLELRTARTDDGNGLG